MEIYTRNKDFLPKVLAGFLVMIALIMLVVFVVVCFVYFPPRVPDSSLSGLGQYGDFFGGFIGAITSIATLGVTVYLAMVLHRLEKENTESAIEGQRKIAIMQFKLKEFALFNEQCDLYMQAIPYAADNHEAIDRAYKSILNASGRITTLFPELDISGNNTEILHFVKNLKVLCDYSKEVNLKMSQHQPPSGIDDLHRKMFDQIGKISKDHHKLMKKLSDWSLE
jgi:uncharacterized membrane protein